MSLSENFEEIVEQKSTKEDRTKAKDWYDGLSKEDQDFLLSKVNGNEIGWKAPMWRASRKNGLDIGLTAFKDFLAKLAEEEK